MSENKSNISIVIASYKQDKELNYLLKQILKAGKLYEGKFEIIIVSDGQEVVFDKDIDKNSFNYYKFEKNSGSGKARDFGVKKSQYEIILFLDSDIEINCDFFQIIDKNIRIDGNDGVIGVVDSLPLNRSVLTAKYLAAETNFLGRKSKINIHQFFIGLCGAIKKNVYLNNFGFYHKVIDDMEFSSRLEKNILIKTSPELVFKHNYSNFFISCKKFFLRSFYFSQLKSKPVSPWFTISRKISTLLSFLSLGLFFLGFFNQLFFYFSLITLTGFLFSCIEIKYFKSSKIDKIFFPFIKFCLQVSISLGYSLGLTKFFLEKTKNYLISKSGPFRIYLRNGKPTYLILYVTGKCNSKCSYCFQWEVLNVKDRVKKELSLGDYKLFAQNLGVIEHLTLGGGEPTLREDLADIAINFYKYNNVRNISMPSNGIRPDLLEKQVEKILRNCPKLILKVSLSIDEVGDQHDKLRGVLGNYERIIESDKVLRKLRDKHKNLYYIINTCFLSQNQENILKIVKENKKRFDHDIQVSTFVRGSLADEDSKDVDINKYFQLVDYLENLQTIVRKNHSYNLDLLHQGLQIESRSSIKHIMRNGYGKYNCTAGKNMLVMDELGNINPCEILPSKFTYGNIKNFNMNIEDLWKTNKVLDIQRRIKKEKCFCTWECAQLNSIAFSFKGLFNMAKHAFRLHERRKQISKLGEISFDAFSKEYNVKENFIDEKNVVVHPMTLEGNNLNPFNVKNEVDEQNNHNIKQTGMDKEELIKKKEQWLKPVKASKIPSNYKFK